MRGLLLVAHGSRLQPSNDEVAALAQRLGAYGGDAFAVVGHAFMEKVSPSLADTLARFAAQGVTEVVVFPYFLGTGQHVTADIPGQVAALRGRFPDLTIAVAPHVGAARGMPELILEQIREAGLS